MGEYAAGLFGAEPSNCFPDGGVFRAKNSGGEARRRAGLRLDRDAENGENGFRGGHAGKVSSAARAGNDDFDAALFGGSRIFKEQIGGAVGGDDAGFMGNTEFAERFGGKFHGVPVGAGTQNDADERVRNFSLGVVRAPLKLRFR